jgi:hypothetical protein
MACATGRLGSGSTLKAGWGSIFAEPFGMGGNASRNPLHYVDLAKGLKMDWREDFDDSLLNEEALSFLHQHELGEIAAGITKQVMGKGMGSLSEKQLAIFKDQVVDAWLMRTCKCGGHSIEGDELIGLWENDGYCSRCAHRMAKDD